MGRALISGKRGERVQLNTMEDFQRDISYRVLKREDGTIALTATLQDRFHDIVAEVIVDARSFPSRKPLRSDTQRIGHSQPEPLCPEINRQNASRQTTIPPSLQFAPWNSETPIHSILP